jgi:flagellar biosynthetic protein FliR
MLDLSIDARFAVGLVLALTRVSAFVVASPVLSKSVPMVGRLAFTVAVGFFLAAPVEAEPTLMALIAFAVINAVVGIVLGYLSGLVFHLFAVAGSLIDLNSGMSLATIYDPSQGESAAVFSRVFNIMALTIFVLAGGLHLMVGGLAISVEAIPLDGRIQMQDGLIELTLSLISRMVVAAIEVALPVLAALFLAEIVLGVAGRFAPQANLLLLGLPAKLLLTLSLIAVSFLLFPEAMDGVLGSVRDTFRDGIDALRVV